MPPFPPPLVGLRSLDAYGNPRAFTAAVREAAYKLESWIVENYQGHVQAAFDGMDRFVPTSFWPPQSPYLRLLLKSGKDRKERFILYVFLFLNGLDPVQAMVWTLVNAQSYKPDVWLHAGHLLNDIKTKRGFTDGWFTKTVHPLRGGGAWIR